MASAAEAEVIALFMNAQEATAIRECLINLGHPQGPISLVTDSSTAHGIITGEMKQKMAKAFDMRKNWIINRTERGIFDIEWAPGKTNLADYFTKHHPGQYHSRIRPIYLKTSNTPRTVQGCHKILNEAHTPQKLKLTPLPILQPLNAQAA